MKYILRNEEAAEEKMRTWRQGVLGKIQVSDTDFLFIKCLKYPLALFYPEEINESSVDQTELFSLFVGLSVFPFIERYGNVKLSSLEKKINKNFVMDFEKGIINTNSEKDAGFRFPPVVIADMDTIQKEFLKSKSAKTTGSSGPSLKEPKID